MHEQIRARLGTLRKELETGQAELDKLEKQRSYLRETMLRIGGAVQVLEEVLSEAQTGNRRNGTGTGEVQPESGRTDPSKVHDCDTDPATR